jgi:hypothetical protein
MGAIELQMVSGTTAWGGSPTSLREWVKRTPSGSCSVGQSLSPPGTAQAGGRHGSRPVPDHQDLLSSGRGGLFSASRTVGVSFCIILNTMVSLLLGPWPQTSWTFPFLRDPQLDHRCVCHAVCLYLCLFHCFPTYVSPHEDSFRIYSFRVTI